MPSAPSSSCMAWARRTAGRGRRVQPGPPRHRRPGVRGRRFRRPLPPPFRSSLVDLEKDRTDDRVRWHRDSRLSRRSRRGPNSPHGTGATSARSAWRSEKPTSSHPQPPAAMFPVRDANRALLPIRWVTSAGPAVDETVRGGQGRRARGSPEPKSRVGALWSCARAAVAPSKNPDYRTLR